MVPQPGQSLDKWRASVARAGAGKEEGQADFITKVAQDLNVIAEETMARLPEDIFIEVFLPVLAGDPPETRKHKEGIADWISVAGSPYKEVDIFDPKTNQVLFRCPPLFDYNGINPVRDVRDRGQRPIADIVNRAEQLNQLHPNQGLHYLKQELGQRLLTMNTGAKLAPNVLRWNAVLQRYNRKPLVEVKGSVPTTPGASQGGSGPSPDDQYEEF
jgi:hypothetical protein